MSNDMKAYSDTRNPRRKPTNREFLESCVVATACLATLTITFGVMLLIAFDKITPALLGTTQGATVGAGLLGLAMIPSWMIRRVIK